ncbi:MAG: chromosomal replication initiator protein DnaA, partial [Candidatus Absconditabacterales bacterium]|nr:chromosomal replication initiator protein DnaA [Candidatus Absconditabacterales bacterium]
RKIFTFLQKAGIISIDEKEQKVYIGLANEFAMSQVKKFLGKQIKETIKEIYNSQFDTEFVIYTPFSSGGELTTDLKKLLQLKENKKEHTIEPKIKNKLFEFFGILFDPIYNFENFIVGANNNFAFSAAKAVSENPGIAYNPLFLYGNVGLGKTHLMQAIGNKIMQDDPEKNVIYLPTSKLIDEIVESLKKNKLNTVLSKFNNIDVLLLDDVQFLSGKDKTQEIFHNIFNDFHMNKKQVIISGDRPPKELINIEPRLKSRFGLGLVADIKAPDFETRIAILQSKLEQKGEEIDYDLLETIAKYVIGNVRELEGALNILITRKKLMGDSLNEQDAIVALETLGYMQQQDNIDMNRLSEGNKKSEKNFANIVEMVAQYYSISVVDLKSDNRKQEITVARQMLMFLAKKYFGWTLEKIGDYFGGKNHTSVIYATNNIEKKIKFDKDLAHDYNVFVEWIEG